MKRESCWDRTNTSNYDSTFNRTRCPECNSRNFVIDKKHGCVICNECGLEIIEDVVEEEYVPIPSMTNPPLGAMSLTYPELYQIRPQITDTLIRLPSPLQKKTFNDFKGRDDANIRTDTEIKTTEEFDIVFEDMRKRVHRELYTVKPDGSKVLTSIGCLKKDINATLINKKPTYNLRQSSKNDIFHYLILTATTTFYPELERTLLFSFTRNEWESWRRGMLYVHKKYKEAISPIYRDKYFVDAFNPNLRCLLFTEQPIDAETASLLTEAIGIMQRKIGTYERETKKSSMSWINIMNEIYLAKLIKKEMNINLLKSDDIIRKALNAWSRILDVYLHHYSSSKIVSKGLSRRLYYNDLKYLKTVDETV